MKPQYDFVSLINEAKEGNEEAKIILMDDNMKLVYSLLKRFHIKNEDYEDVKQQALLGLMIAINNFDISYNVCFSTYAVPLILGEIKKYYKEGRSIKISRSIKELNSKIIKAKEELEEKFLHSPTIKEISSYLNEPLENIIEAMDASKTLLYLDEPLNEDELTLLQVVEGDSFSLMDVNINLALSHLNKKERMIIYLRYYEGYSQQEVAKRLFISQVQVSRIESKILKKMKEYV